MPFVERGVPSADLIDLDYGYGNVFHHTPQDTMDKLSPKSIEIAGKVSSKPSECSTRKSENRELKTKN